MMGTSKSINWKVFVPILVAVIGALGVIIAQMLSTRPPIPADAYGKILGPTSGDSISGSFQVIVELANIPEGDHIWLATGIGNLMWIKKPSIPSSDKRWTGTIAEPLVSPGGSFSLILLQASSEGQGVIENWLARGKQTGEYPGFSEIPGSRRLDVVTDIKARHSN